MNILFKIFQFFFKMNIMELIENERQKVIAERNEYDEQLKNQCIMYEYPIKTLVFTISNEPSDLTIGEVIGYEMMHKQIILILRNIKTGEEYFTFDNKPCFWSPTLEKIFSKMDWCERWNVYSKGRHELSNEDRLRKEAYTTGFLPQPKLIEYGESHE